MGFLVPPQVLANYSSMSTEALRLLLAQRSLIQTGTRCTVIDRLHCSTANSSSSNSTSCFCYWTSPKPSCRPRFVGPHRSTSQRKITKLPWSATTSAAMFTKWPRTLPSRQPGANGHQSSRAAPQQQQPTWRPNEHTEPRRSIQCGVVTPGLPPSITSKPLIQQHHRFHHKW